MLLNILNLFNFFHRYSLQRFFAWSIFVCRRRAAKRSGRAWVKSGSDASSGSTEPLRWSGRWSFSVWPYTWFTPPSSLDFLDSFNPMPDPEKSGFFIPFRGRFCPFSECFCMPRCRIGYIRICRLPAMCLHPRYLALLRLGKSANSLI